MADLDGYRVQNSPTPHCRAPGRHAHDESSAIVRWLDRVPRASRVERSRDIRDLPSALAMIDALHHATRAQKTAGAASTKGTTHVSVIDADGMIASMTTSNGSCSGVLGPGYRCAAQQHDG